MWITSNIYISIYLFIYCRGSKTFYVVDAGPYFHPPALLPLSPRRSVRLERSNAAGRLTAAAVEQAENRETRFLFEVFPSHIRARFCFKSGETEKKKRSGGSRSPGEEHLRVSVVPLPAFFFFLARLRRSLSSQQRWLVPLLRCFKSGGSLQLKPKVIINERKRERSRTTPIVPLPGCFIHTCPLAVSTITIPLPISI